MTRAERNTLALILLALAFIGLRIVATAYAQETPEQADRTPPVSSAGSPPVLSRAAENRDAHSLQTGMADGRVTPSVEAGTPSAQSATGTTSPDSAHGVRASVVDDATVLVLAQAMVADGGWNARGDQWDHEMIAHALLAQSVRRRVPLREQALAYVASFDPRRNVPRAAWVRCLNLAASKPCHWPDATRWSSHAKLWRGIVAKARRFLRDPSSVPNPCPDGYHFGQRTGEDGRRAKRAGWRRAVCWAQTRNGVWSLALAGSL